MAFKILLDANIVLDFTLQRDVGYEDAKEVVGKILTGSVAAYVTDITVHIAGYYLTRAHKVTTAKQMLLTFLSDVRTLDIADSIVHQALRSAIPDIEDAMQYYSALHHRLDYFVSRDKPLFKHAVSQLPIVTPRDFLDHIL